MKEKGISLALKRLVHHINAPAHIALSVNNFRPKQHDKKCPPLYSSNFALYDFFLLYPRLKRNMRGKLSITVEEVKQKLLKGLKNMPVSELKKNVLNNGRIVCRGALRSKKNTVKIIKIWCKGIQKFRFFVPLCIPEILLSTSKYRGIRVILCDL